MTKEILDITSTSLKDLTLDTYLDRHPSTLKFPEDYQAMVVNVLRPERARFITTQEKKKEKKEGIEVENGEEEKD